MRSMRFDTMPVRRAALAAAAVAMTTLAAGAAWAQEAQPPAQPPAQQQQAQPGLTFGSDVGIIINNIKADKTADFEEVVGKIKEALQKSELPERKAQAAGWKVFKVAEAGPNGTVMYFFLMDPVVKDADYGMAKILVEAFPADARAIWDKLVAAYSGSNRLNLQLISDFGK